MEIRSTWPWVLNSQDHALSVGENQINMAVGAEFTRRRTICRREWVEIGSTWLSVLNSQLGRRTICGREWVEMRSTWPLVLNSQDDALPVDDNGWKSDQYGHQC